MEGGRGNNGGSLELLGVDQGLVFPRTEPKAKVGAGVPSDPLSRPSVSLLLSTRNPTPCPVSRQLRGPCEDRFPIFIPVL